MILGQVIGKVISNQKSTELIGSKLLLVKEIDEYGNKKDKSYVAIDKVGAGVNDKVLLGEFNSTLRRDMYQDNMAIVAIIEQVQLEE